MRTKENAMTKYSYVVEISCLVSVSLNNDIPERDKTKYIYVGEIGCLVSVSPNHDTRKR